MSCRRDADVRPGLVARLRAAHPGSQVLEEMGLHHGHVRVDVAVISADCLHGYEVKADADTLKRLPVQVWRYGEVMDRCTLVVGLRHLDAALPLLPAWWGIVIASRDGFHAARPALPNPDPCAHNTCRLLWREESLALLDEVGAARGVRGKAKNTLYRRLVEVVPAAELRAHVRRLVVARGDWRQP
ncbi:sce7726 family protein [Pyxidicoccus caerfyrddinensis]|uniref:sce7726 family protein n=1 Tax=Pyxidicoccus caerfyrddinensis TaxID=2709663 RepID=UPI0013DBBA0E|nr:sce7726 family protein [Pyxidicoccus caerfyrddinensis]